MTLPFQDASLFAGALFLSHPHFRKEKKSSAPRSKIRFSSGASFGQLKMMLHEAETILGRDFSLQEWERS